MIRRATDIWRTGRGRGVAVVIVAVALSILLAAPPSARANETVWSCGNGLNAVFASSAAFGINTPYACPGDAGETQGMSIQNVGSTVSQGQRGDWQANAPAGLVIVGASIPQGQLWEYGINDGDQYGGGFYWAGGGSEIHDVESSAQFGPLWTPYFGWQIICGANPCTYPFNDITVSDIALDVQETVGPTLSAPSGLWQANGWVRGTWPLVAWGNSPSGLCAIVADFGLQTLPGTTSSRDQSAWHQCAAGPVSDSVPTTAYPQGGNRLHLGAWDAASEIVDEQKTVYVDNQQPTISLSGPSEVPSTAGGQHMTATAAAGPSGVYGILCSVDGAPAHWYGAPSPQTPASNVGQRSLSAQIPVSGLGEHSVQCSAANHAVDAAGHRGWSTSVSRSLKIGDPTVSGISFFNVANALRCQKIHPRVSVHTRTRTKISRRGQTRLVTVTKCHPRTKLERVIVRVRVRRHGKRIWIKRTKRERVVVLPRLVASNERRVAFGQSTTVSGWLGSYNGTALGGRTISVLSAPDDGRQQFTTAATVATASDGSWTAALPPGPSRLIEAAYGGGPTTESSVSGQVHLTVPARVRLLNVSPRRVAWGGTIRLVGQLEGGYLPPGGALVRLRIGQGSSFTTYGVHTHVGGNGVFSTTYTFGAGEPSIHRFFWFEIASLPMGDYPYAPADSRRISVIVGGHPRTTPHQRK